jgi:hypothetical protein
VHVTPKSAKDEVAGWRGNELWVKVTAAPEGGKANASVERLLASTLGIPKSRAHVVRGHTSRIKTVEFDGVHDADVVAALGTPDAQLF